MTCKQPIWEMVKGPGEAVSGGASNLRSSTVHLMQVTAHKSLYIILKPFRLNTPRDIPAKGLLRLGSKYKYNGRTQKQAALDYSNQVRTNSNFERWVQ